VVPPSAAVPIGSGKAGSLRSTPCRRPDTLASLGARSDIEQARCARPKGVVAGSLRSPDGRGGRLAALDALSTTRP